MPRPKKKTALVKVIGHHLLGSHRNHKASCKILIVLSTHPFNDLDMAKRKNKHEGLLGQYVIHWSSVSGDGWRVKHRMYRDNELPYCFWHIEIRLTDNPAALCEGGYEVYPRKFFGKVWIAQKIEYKRAGTWKAIAEAVRELELKEKRII